MDQIYGTSFQPVQARAFTDAYTRAAAADRSARLAARSRMEVTGAAPVRSVRDKPSDNTKDTFERRFGRASARFAGAGSRAPAAQAVRDAWPLSFAGVLAMRRGA